MKKLFLLYWSIAPLFALWLIFCLPWISSRGLIPFPTRYLVTAFAPWSTTFGMPVKSAAMPDVITQIYPWKHITIASWKAGSVPLWNPYSFAGSLHAGNYQTAVFSPMNILYFFMSASLSWTVMILLQPLLAGIFMFLFLRSEDRSHEAALIGSVGFMFCGFLVVWMAYGTLGYAALVLPLCLFAIHTYHRRGKRWALPLLSFAVAFSFASGHFQISLYVLLCCLAYTVHQAMTFGKKRTFVLTLVFIGLGLGLVVPQLWETIRAYAASVRSSSFGNGEVIPWQYLITLFAPDVFGNPVTRNDWYGHYAEWAGFIGVVPLLLAFLSLRYANRKQTNFFAILGVIALLFTLPTPLVDLLYKAHIPVLSTSAASRLIVLYSFAMSVLAAHGTDAVFELWKKRQKRVGIFIFLIAIIFLTLYWGMLLGMKPLVADKLAIAVRNSVLPSIVLMTAVSVIGVGMFVPKKYGKILLWVLIGLCMVDGVRFASKWMPFEPRAYLYPSLPIIEKIRTLPDINTSRVMGNFGNEFSGMYGIQGLEGYDAVYNKRYGELVSAVSTGTIGELSRSVVLMDKHGVFTEKFVQLLGVVYYMHKISDGRFPWAYPFWEYDHYDSFWRDGVYELFRNTTAYPRAYLASSYQKITEPQSIITTLFSDAFDRRDSVILEENPQVFPRSGVGQAQIISYQPEKIVMRVHTEVPKLLFLSDVYDAGWRAYVSGKESKIYRADYAFRAVSVPAGSSTVVMSYEPPSMRYGMIIALAALLGILGYSGYYIYYAHRIL